jgi:hypothetical protein
MPNDEIDLEHAKSFIDVVFGVLIALPLTEVFPQYVSDVITKRCLACGESLLLLTAALVFSTFYWLEVRRFIDEQTKFDRAINAGGLSLGRLLGSLMSVSLAATILKFANIDTLRAFLIANLFFWLIDLFGNIGLKYRYKQKDVKAIEKTHPDEYEWYIKNIQPYGKGPFYSSINMVFFGLILAGDYIWHDLEIYQCIIASLIFVFTLFRHLFLRIKY